MASSRTIPAPLPFLRMRPDVGKASKFKVRLPRRPPAPAGLRHPLGRDGLPAVRHAQAHERRGRPRDLQRVNAVTETQTLAV